MFGWFNKKKPPATDEPDRSTLVPRIKTAEYLASLEDRGVPADQLPYTEPLVADLVVSYAFDLPALFMMASGDALAGLGVPLSEARGLAVANLERQLSRVGFADRGPFRQVVTGDDLEACTLLVESFWDQVAADADGEVVVGVPSRDVVLFCDSHSARGVAAIRAFSAAVMEDEDAYRLTDQLLVWRGGRWAEFTPEADE